MTYSLNLAYKRESKHRFLLLVEVNLSVKIRVSTPSEKRRNKGL